MSHDIIHRWFEQLFVPEVNRFLESKNFQVKALLILNNAGAHPDEERLRKGEI